MKKVESNEKRLTEWVKGLAYSNRSEGTFTDIQVRQVLNKSKNGDEVALIKIPDLNDRSDGWERELAISIINTLNIEASTLGGTQHYACYGRFSDYDGVVSRSIVTVYGSSGENTDDDDLLSEAPNAKGLVAQAMRHQEANARINSGMILQAMETLRRQNMALSEQNEKLMNNRFDLMNEIAEVHEQRHQQFLEQKHAEVKTKAIEEAIQSVRLLGPAIVNKIVGKDLLPVDKSMGVTAVAKSLYPSLSQEQHDALEKVLRPDQLMHFYELGESLLSDDSKQQKTG